MGCIASPHTHTSEKGLCFHAERLRLSRTCLVRRVEYPAFWPQSHLVDGRCGDVIGLSLAALRDYCVQMC